MGYDYPADPNNLTSFIRKLRKKIEPEPDRPRYIVIIRGVGYKYTENEEMVGKTATPPECVRRGGGRKTSSHTSFAGKRLWFTLTVGRVNMS